MTTATLSKAVEWQVRQVGFGDLIECLGAGARDFRASPSFGLAFGVLYAVAGWSLVALAYHYAMPYLAYPLGMGFTLIAPGAAVGLYSVSADREAGRASTWGSIFRSIRSAFKGDLAWMAAITGFILIIWMDSAAFLFSAFVGIEGYTDLAELVNTLFTTPNGLVFLVVGNLIGACIAVFAFSISVTSLPMLFDQKVDFVTAMITSVKVVRTNPVTMLLWASVIAALMLVSIASAFVAFLLVLPLVGHATWHLYRCAVVQPQAPAVTDARS